MFGSSGDLIFLFGDSITQQGFDPSTNGWAAALADRYVRKLSVANGGLSGYSTDQALQVLPQIIPPPSHANIKILVIFFGANDSRRSGTGDATSPEQHVPLEEYKQNLKDIIHHPQVQEHKPKIILVTPPPIDEHVMTDKKRFAETTAEYAEAVRSVSQECGVECLDIWSSFMAKVGWKLGEKLVGCADVEQNPATGLPNLLIDGLHLNWGGNSLLFQKLSKFIITKWPEMAPGSLPYALPTWGSKAAFADIFAKRDEVAGKSSKG